MLQVFGDIRTENNDIVHVHACKLLQTRKLFVHEALERAWCVCEAERHNLEFVQTPLAYERGTVLMLRVNFNLMIPLLEI